MSWRLREFLGVLPHFVSIYRSRRWGISCQRIAEIPLRFEQMPFIGNIDQGIDNGRVSVRMEGHRLPRHIGDFMKFPIVHQKQGPQNTPLNGFQAINGIRDRASRMT